LKRALAAAKRLVVILIARGRRALGILMQRAQRDQLYELSHQTQGLRSASVEAVTYVGGELHALDERLSRVEKELAELRRLLERQQRPENSDPSESSQRHDEVASGPANAG
jgi:hypothetical protein